MNFQPTRSTCTCSTRAGAAAGQASDAVNATSTSARLKSRMCRSYPVGPNPKSRLTRFQLVSSRQAERGFLREAARNRRLLGVAAIAAIGGFLFGYDTGVIGGAMLFMKSDLGLKSHGQQQLTVAILLLGAITGALI